MEEKWKYIEGSINGYISSFGRVKDNEKIISPYTDPEGYLRCTVKGVGRERIHRWVAKYFIPNPNDFKYVDHIDKNKQNNCINNLRWVDASINGKNAYQPKSSIKSIIGINAITGEIKEFSTQVEAGKYIGCKDPYHGGEVNKVLKGKRKITHGWKFFYLTPENKEKYYQQGE